MNNLKDTPSVLVEQPEQSKDPVDCPLYGEPGSHGAPAMNLEKMSRGGRTRFAIEPERLRALGRSGSGLRSRFKRRVRSYCSGMSAASLVFLAASTRTGVVSARLAPSLSRSVIDRIRIRDVRGRVLLQ